MQMPKAGSSTPLYVSFGQYVIGRCVRNGARELTTPLHQVDTRLVTVTRALEDLDAPLALAVANRDAVDDELDDVARWGRLQLANRSLDATATEPYTKIFGEGIGEFTKAKVGEGRIAFDELATRFETFLPEEDPLRVEVVPKLTALLVEWEAAVKAVEDARKAVSIARIERESTVSAWEKVVNDTYAALIARVGKKKAERFFPRRSRGKKAPTEATAPPAAT